MGERLEILLDTTKRHLPPRAETLRLGNLLLEDYDYEQDSQVGEAHSLTLL